jgi:DNA-binding MarR family transcriptional regulator
MGTEMSGLSESERAMVYEAATACACSNVRMASRAIAQRYDAALQPSGLRITQFTLLVAVTIADGGTISALADHLVMDRTTLARDLELLARQGWVTITIGRDRRTRIVTITEAGTQALAQALPLWEREQARIVAGLGDDRWRALTTELAELVTLTRRD